MTMNRILLKKMVGEVSQPILGGLLADYAQQIIDAEELTEDVVAAIDIISAELKSRTTGGSNSQRQRRSRAKKTEEVVQESDKPSAQTTQNTPAPPRSIQPEGGVNNARN